MRKTYWDERLGILYRVIVIDDLGQHERHLNAIAQYKFDTPAIRNLATYGAPSDVMPMTPKIFIYTNKLYSSIEEVRKVFTLYQPDSFVELVVESELHKTLFISYGGSDEEMASKINNVIKSRGVETWFFPEDSIPGDKLHRMMSEAVSKSDRMLLICSKESVLRHGVLNEIERMLEREANEGGSDTIIPVALDEYTFNEWSPERVDIKQQVTSSVVSKIHNDNFDSEIEKILFALRRWVDA